MPHIALLTDFGTRDPYVAAMKGVLASRTEARVHDLSHEIAPFDVLEAAWFLRSVVAYWPERTIFVCVVDPGVGTERRIVAVAHGRHLFLAPDNGLLTFVCAAPGDAGAGRPRDSRRDAGVPREAPGTPASRRLSRRRLGAVPRAFSVENEALFLPDGSTTFHGRDRFAPVAAALANGLRIEDVGPRIETIELLPYEPPAYGEVVRGTIVAIDRFGNAITDIERSKIPFDSFALRVRDVTIDRVERTYGGAAPGPFLIVGSTGCIEISVANASAAERLHLRRLERIELWPMDPSDSRAASSRS